MHDGPVPGDVERLRRVADVTAPVLGDVNPGWLRVLHPHLLLLQHRRLHAAALSERPCPRGIVGLQDVVLGHGLDLVAQRGLELVELAAQFAEREQKGSVHVDRRYRQRWRPRPRQRRGHGRGDAAGPRRAGLSG
jgi:hypothetical protein